MRDAPKITIQQVAWHRNGISGVGFHAVLFTDAEHGPMLGIVYDEAGYCSVVQVPMLSDPDTGVAFGENSWRGDNYEPLLRKAIKENDSDGSVRIGPFALPTARKKAAK